MEATRRSSRVRPPRRTASSIAGDVSRIGSSPAPDARPARTRPRRRTGARRPVPTRGWPVATLPGVAVSRMTDLVGRVLSGRYRLIAPIGSGASAQVFLADDTRLRRRVAVKLLHAALADDDGFLRRFRAEAQAAAALNHPNIVAVYDWGDDDGTPYLVTEYLAGGSLRAMLDHGVAPVTEPGAARRARGDPRPRLRPPPGVRPPRHQARQPPLRRGRAAARRRLRSRPGPGRGGVDRARRRRARHRPLRLARERTRRVGRRPGRRVLPRARPRSRRVTGKVPFAADTTIATLMAQGRHARRGACRPRAAARRPRPRRPARRPTTGPTPGSSPSGSWPRPRSCRGPIRCRSSVPRSPTACAVADLDPTLLPGAAAGLDGGADATLVTTAVATDRNGSHDGDRGGRRRPHRARARRGPTSRRRRRWPRVLLAVSCSPPSPSAGSWRGRPSPCRATPCPSSSAWTAPPPSS